jgi:S1-C subfamily serine protease
MRSQPSFTRLPYRPHHERRLWAALLLALTPALTAAPVEADRDLSDLLAMARPKVVLIEIRTRDTPRWGTGFVAARGRVLTNEHVVRSADTVVVWANGAAYRARVAAVDAARDLAALVLPDAPLELKPLTLAPSGRGAPGEPVLILASRTQAARRSRAAPAGRIVRVSPVAGTAWDYTWLQWADGPPAVDRRLLARAIPGDSGSPVLRRSDGAVIGIVRGRTYPDEAGRSETAWAVPIEAAHALLALVADPAPPAADRSERFYLEALAGH